MAWLSGHVICWHDMSAFDTTGNKKFSRRILVFSQKAHKAGFHWFFLCYLKKLDIMVIKLMWARPHLTHPICLMTPCFRRVNHLENSNPPLTLFNQTRRDYLGSYARCSYTKHLWATTFFTALSTLKIQPLLLPASTKQDAIRFICSIRNIYDDQQQLQLFFSSVRTMLAT